MADNQSRIENFRKMAEADPDNELSHFSLGRAYLDGGINDDAVRAFQRVIALNPRLSKVYQLLAQALLALGRRDEAIAQLTDGVKMADSRGDLMPKNDMIKMLKDLGAPLPEMRKAAEPERPAGEGEVHCKRCSRVARKIAGGPPFSNAQGKLIYDSICSDCWREWIAMGTKVINELRLPLADPQAQKVFDRHMMEFLNLQG